MHTPSIAIRDSKFPFDSARQTTIARLGLRSRSELGLGLGLGLGTRLPVLESASYQAYISNTRACACNILYMAWIVDGKEKVWTIPGVKAV